MNELPDKPGCYIFKDKLNNIIYIGKAKNLKKRVSSYFKKNQDNPKTQSLSNNIAKTDFIITNNEVEALILENNLIKKHTPKYNIDLKDSKRYAYIGLTNEEFPRILTARSKNKEGLFFGPFISGTERELILETLKKSFAIRTCKKMKKKSCLRRHIGLCDAPCIGLINKEEYDHKITKVILALKGKNKELKKVLEKEMIKASKNEEYERCINIRNQLSAINILSEKQNMERQIKYDEDILNYKVSENKVFLLIFNVYKGILENKKEFVFDYMKDSIEEFIIQYYSENKTKKELSLPSKISQPLIEYLKNHKIKVTFPKKGEKKKLLDLALKNIESEHFKNTNKIEKLKNRLNLKNPPRIIECFDISHLSGTSTAGSMVQFRNGTPDKSNYRMFKIKTVEGIDDISSIKEVVLRRYSRLKKEDSKMPDLIIIDGGKGQLNAAISSLKLLNLNLPIISIAKREEEIYSPHIDSPIRLEEKDPALLFIREIRDEAHRFAIKYHKILRSKKNLDKDKGKK